MEFLRLIIGPDDGTASIAQICARAVILFVFGIICIRVAGRRTFAQYSPLDIIVAIVVGSNISRIMTGKADFVAGVTATLLIVVLHRILAMLSLRWPFLGRIIKGGAVILIQDAGTPVRHSRRHLPFSSARQSWYWRGARPLGRDGASRRFHRKWDHPVAASAASLRACSSKRVAEVRNSSRKAWSFVAPAIMSISSACLRTRAAQAARAIAVLIIISPSLPGSTIDGPMGRS